MSKKIKILILALLLLNILLIGVIIGHVSQRVGRKEFMKRHAPVLSVKLPEDKEKLLFDTMKRVHLQNRDVYKQIRESRKKAISILTAPEFDEAAYQIEVEKLHELHGLMKQQLSDATKELAKQFNQEERKALAEHLRRPPRYRKGPPFSHVP